MAISSSRYLQKIIELIPSTNITDIELIKDEFGTTFQKIYQLLKIDVPIDEIEYIFNANREMELPPSLLSLAILYNAVNKDIYAFLETVDILVEYRSQIEQILLTDEHMETLISQDYQAKFKQSTRICYKLTQLLRMNYSAPAMVIEYLESTYYTEGYSSEDEDLSLLPSSTDYGYNDDDQKQKEDE